MGFYSSTKTRVFISFDYDYDRDIKELLVGQAKNENTPFDIADYSVKDELAGNWKEKVRQRMKNVDQVIVLCGKYTGSASGVNAEVIIAQEERKSYFLLAGRGDDSIMPRVALSSDKIYRWTWDNLKALIGGSR